MATSGITTTELNRDSIIKGAMRKIAALSKGQVPDTEDLSNASEALNNLVAEYMTLGMPLWAETFANIPMVGGVNLYTLGVGQQINMAFPLRILQAWTTLTDGGSKQELNETALYDYSLLPTATLTSGVPSQYTYHPKINYGTFRIWPTPDSVTASQRTLTIRYNAPFDTFVAGTDTPYFPREWNNALVYGLAALLAPEYGVPLNDRGMLMKEAEAHKQTALDAGTEWASLFFQPDRREYY